MEEAAASNAAATALAAERVKRADKYEQADKRRDKHWTDKALDEMSERDWRIFREDFAISYSGGRCPNPFRSWVESPLSEARFAVLRRLCALCLRQRFFASFSSSESGCSFACADAARTRPLACPLTPALPLSVPISQPILRAVEKVGYTKPSPIQMASIPVGLLGRDCIGIAETGSGKTAAFVLPMLAYIMKQPLMRGNEEIEAEGPYSIIMAPTRELAQQIEEETVKFAQFLDYRVVSLVGGQNIEEQGFKLRKGYARPRALVPPSHTLPLVPLSISCHPPIISATLRAPTPTILRPPLPLRRTAMYPPCIPAPPRPPTHPRPPPAGLRLWWARPAASKTASRSATPCSTSATTSCSTRLIA